MSASSSSDCLSSVSSNEDDSNTILIHFENTDPARFLKNPSLISYQTQSDFSERPVNDEMHEKLLELMHRYEDLSHVTRQLNRAIVSEEIKHGNLTHGDLFQILKFTYDDSPFVMNIPAQYMDQKEIIQLIKERYVINQDIFEKLKVLGDLQISNAVLEFGKNDGDNESDGDGNNESDGDGDGESDDDGDSESDNDGDDDSESDNDK